LSDSAARRLGVDATNRVATISVLTYIMVIVLGATAIGAEYRAGTVTTILTWEPRRIRLLVARLLAAALVAMLMFVVVQLVFVGGWVLGAKANGVTAGAGGDFWRALALVLARGTLLAGALAVLSGAFATLGRNTGAALGIWFGYLIAFEAILSANVKATTPWMLTLSAGALYGWESTSLNGHRVTAVGGTLHLVLYLVLVGGAALVVFRRRDVA
jgi:ABC-type transport system involved in multi-copper enzyme maturation permease subunit